jgi:enoyl-CoA hydratase/carnithine racemase
MTDAVLYEPATAEQPIGLLRLNRPDARNSMSGELLDAFAIRAKEAAGDALARAVIVTGSGTCFSAGADLRGDIQRHGDGPARMPHEASYAMYTSFLSILDVPVPVLGALNGHAVGGGFGLSLLCDIRIGARTAKYGANFARLGLHSGLGISYTLPRLIGVSRASELLFTGRLIDGEEAERIGLLSKAVAPDAVLGEALALAREIAAAAPIAVRGMKATMRHGLGWDVREAAWQEAYAQSATVQTADFDEGVKALLEKRPPRFEGR